MADNNPFNRPIGSIVTDDEIAEAVDVYYSAANAVRQHAEVKWKVSHIVLDGFFNFSPNWETRQVTVNPSDPKGSLRTKIPELLNRYRREKGRLLSFIRPPTTRPLATGDPNIWRANRFSNGAANYIYRKTKFPLVGDSWLGDLLMQGTAGLLTYWDDFAKEIAIRPIPGWQLYPFPSTAVDDLSTEGIIWERVVSEEWIKQNIPEAQKEAKVKITTPYSAAKAFMTSTSPAIQQGYCVRYAFFKPSRRFPKGEQVILVGKKVYRRLGELATFIGDQRELPIAIARYTKKSDSWWGESFGYSIAMINQDINRIMTLMMRRGVLRAHPGYIMIPQGTAAKDDFMNQIGGLVEYRQPLGSPDTRPYWLTYSSGPPDTDMLLNRMQLFADDVSSQHNASSGESAGRVDSMSGMNTLIQQDMLPSEGTVKQIDAALQHTFGIALDLAYRRWDTPRKSRIVGPMRMPTELLVQQNDLPSMEDIEINTGLELAMDKQTQLNFLNSLATPPAANIPAKLSDEEYRRGLVSLGVNIPGVDLISPDEEQAWLENVQMYGDGNQPRGFTEPNPQLENTEIHLRIHKAYTATPEVHAASPQVQAAFSEHIRLHSQAIAPSPMPPNFDRDYQTMNDDLMESQILAAGA